MTNNGEAGWNTLLRGVSIDIGGSSALPSPPIKGIKTMNDLDIKNLPEEYTTTVYLVWKNEYSWAQVSEYSPDDPDSFLIAEPIEITFKMRPREDATKEAVEGLRREIEKVRAAANIKCNQIEEKIQSLLALPNLEKEDE